MYTIQIYIVVYDQSFFFFQFSLLWMVSGRGCCVTVYVLHSFPLCVYYKLTQPLPFPNFFFVCDACHSAVCLRES